MNTSPQKPSTPGLTSLLRPYAKFLIFLALLAIGSNGLGLLLPELISKAMDGYTENGVLPTSILWVFAIAIIGILVLSLFQSLVQTYASEKVARDLREKLAAKISEQSTLTIEEANPSKLLTNLTSDIDSIKLFVSQTVVSMVSSVLLIIGSSVLLLNINWKLALVVLVVIPLVGGTFFFVLKRVRKLFMRGREAIDFLNKVINESILGAALIRVLSGQKEEERKFSEANTEATSIGLQILKMFALLIPIIVFASSLAGLAILVMGGHFVIQNTMTLGEFTAFNSYLAMLIFPIMLIGFMSNIIAQATVSYERISVILHKETKPSGGTLKKTLQGKVTVQNVSLQFGEKMTLKDISFTVEAQSRTAILGPTAAGKSQLLSLMTGLTEPTSGNILYDDHDIHEYDPVSFYRQIGLVFQESIIFNMSIRDNIAFNTEVSDEHLEKAIQTAELSGFIENLPEGIDTLVSERGTTLSGGQKQRIMLARALALNPKILLLDDFTARVDTETETRILFNLKENYPDLTLISVTQKIAAIESYEQIIVLMEGELLAKGTHKELMQQSPEYVQIYNSQRSTNHYELQA